MVFKNHYLLKNKPVISDKKNGHVKWSIVTWPRETQIAERFRLLRGLMLSPRVLQGLINKDFLICKRAAQGVIRPNLRLLAAQVLVSETQW